MPVPELTHEMIMVMAMIAVAVFLFIVEWIRVDVVAILVGVVALPLLGLVTGEQAISGFSSNAVISIIAVIIIGAGLDKTGLINRVVAPIIRIAGRSESRLITLLASTIAIVSSFMQNIGAAALFLPAIQRTCKQTGIPISRVLMPVGFAAILGGTVTLVGSSPLILLNDLLAQNKDADLAPFGLFDVTPVGLALVAAGILYFILFGRFVLPAKQATGEAAGAAADPSRAYEHLGEMYELEVPADAPLNPEIRWLRDNLLVHVVALSPDGGRTKIMAPETLHRIEGGTTLVVVGRPQMVRTVCEIFGFRLKDELEVFRQEMSSDLSGMVEVVVAPRSSFVGRTLRQMYLRKEFQVTPLAIGRGDRLYYGGLSTLVLQPGDTILLHGTWERFHMLQARQEFIFTHPLEADVMHPQKAIRAALCLAVALCLVLFADILLSVCLMTGALGMILTRVLTVDQAYRAVDWRTIFLLAGLIPLGIATQETGTASYIAAQVLTLVGDVGPLVLMAVVGILSTVFTLVVSNVGATVLLVPLVINMALRSGADPRMAALVVGLATSNSFLLPTHQVNALYMGPGHYRSTDYMRAGAIMSVVFLVVMVLVLSVFY